MNIVLAAGASAALHKSCDLASKLAQEGHAVRAVLTRRASALVSPQLFEALTGESAWVDEFGDGRRGGMDHITLAQWAKLFVVAPCPADLLSRLALGLADDLVTTVALALAPEVPRLVCPAMNPATGLVTLAATYSAACCSSVPPISPIMTIASVSGSAWNPSRQSMKFVPMSGSPPIPMHVD